MPVRQWLQSASHLILSLMSVIGYAILDCGSMTEVMWLGSSQQVDKVGIKEMSVKSTHVVDPLRHCLAYHWYYAVPTQLPNTEAATCTLAAGNKLTTLTFSVFGRASFHPGDDCQLVAILDDRLWGPLSDWSVSHHAATPPSTTDQRTMAGTTTWQHPTDNKLFCRHHCLLFSTSCGCGSFVTSYIHFCHLLTVVTVRLRQSGITAS